MTFPPPLHGERPADRVDLPTPQPLGLDDVVAERYTIDQVLSVGPVRSLYKGRDPDRRRVFVLQMSAPLHPAPAFDPDATVPTSRAEGNLILSTRQHATEGMRSFVVFEAPRGSVACLGGRYGWDPDRLILLGRIIGSLRQARDGRFFLPHCSWETLFLDPQLDVYWISPAISSTRFRVEDRGMSSQSAVEAAPTVSEPDDPMQTTQQLEEFYMSRLRELIPSLVLHNFAAVPPGESPEELLPEEIPWMRHFVSSPEVRQLLSELIGGRIQTLDEALAAVESFGAERVVRLRQGWETHRGRIRELNEDSLLVLQQSSVVRSRPMRITLYAVADGMGGHEAGEIASEITLKALSREILGSINLTSALEHGRTIEDQDFLAEILSRCIDRTNEVLRQFSQEAYANSRKKPGSTLVFALVCGPIACVGHVGDSRAYKVLLDGSLERVTRDHSPVQRMVDLCKITPEEAFNHPNRHQIYSNIGISPSNLTKGVETRYLKEGEGLLLCSDGLSDMLRDAEIEQICMDGYGNPRRLSHTLVEAACEAGGMDNVTVIVMSRAEAPFKEEREIPTNIPDDEDEEVAPE